MAQKECSSVFWYATKLGKNLISLSELSYNGYSFKCDGESMKMWKGSFIIMEGIHMSRMHLLQGFADISCNLVDESKLWHQRLGYVNRSGTEE